MDFGPWFTEASDVAAVIESVPAAVVEKVDSL